MDEAGWAVELLRPDRETFRGPPPEAALAWALVWLMRDEFLGGVVG